MDIQWDDYIAGGYILTHGMVRPSWMDPHLIPDHYLSLSGCISDRLPIATAWHDEIPDEARNLGMTQDEWSRYKAWSHHQLGKQVGYPDTFYTLDTAQYIQQCYLADSLSVLIGVALHHTRVDGFLLQHAETGRAYGVYHGLQQGQTLIEGGVAQGFDILGYGNGINHSWLCYSLETRVKDRFNITPNELGLIANADDANCVRKFARQEEPGWHWEAWLIVYYAEEND